MFKMPEYSVHLIIQYNWGCLIRFELQHVLLSYNDQANCLTKKMFLLNFTDGTLELVWCGDFQHWIAQSY